MRAATQGLISGTIATLGMSLPFYIFKKSGLQGEHPPKRVMQGLIKAIGETPDEPKLSVLTAVGHLGFGMLAGSLFAAVREKLGSKRQPALVGAAYGLGIWALSYKGVVPALRFMPPPEKDRPGRVFSNVLAHLVYGSLLGIGVSQAEK